MVDYFKKFFYTVAIFNFFVLLIVYLLEYYLNIGMCELCYYQRIAFAAVIVVSIIGILAKVTRKFAGVLVVLLYFANSGIALTQVLMEEKFITPSNACTGLIPSGVSDIETFKARIMSNGYTPCDSAEFKFVGISLAGYSFIASTGMFIFSLIFVGVFILFRYKDGRVIKPNK